MRSQRPARQAERFTAWSRPVFPPAEYATRRALALARLAEDEVLLVSSAEGTSGGETFRQLDDFEYFAGLEVPQSALAIDGHTRRAMLFVPPRDPRFENAGRPNDFPGRPLASDAVMRQVATITVQAIAHGATQVRPGVDERTLAGSFVGDCMSRGAQRVAFTPIIKSGTNSLWPWRILGAQYDRRNRVLEDGDLVIYDVGCEREHYASDVGRTFPVSGTFTSRQRALVEMVRLVSDAVIMWMSSSRSPGSCASLSCPPRGGVAPWTRIVLPH
ncbi:hypothetical protein BH11GEM1_BH11GEM1_25850 [soil metagenome]